MKLFYVEVIMEWATGSLSISNKIYMGKAVMQSKDRAYMGFQCPA